MAKKVTDETKAAVLQKAEVGQTYATIAWSLGISVTTVRKIIRENDEQLPVRREE